MLAISFAQSWIKVIQVLAALGRRGACGGFRSRKETIRKSRTQGVVV